MEPHKIQQLLHEALAAWSIREFQRAKALCIEILSAVPDHPQASGLLAQISSQEQSESGSFRVYPESDLSPHSLAPETPPPFTHSWEADESELPLEYEEGGHNEHEHQSSRASNTKLAEKQASEQQLRSLLAQLPEGESNLLLLEALEIALQRKKGSQDSKQSLPSNYVQQTPTPPTKRAPTHSFQAYNSPTSESPSRESQQAKDDNKKRSGPFRMYASRKNRQSSDKNDSQTSLSGTHNVHRGTGKQSTLSKKGNIGRLAQAFDNALAKDKDTKTSSSESNTSRPTSVSSSYPSLSRRSRTGSHTRLTPQRRQATGQHDALSGGKQNKKHEKLRRLAESIDKKLAEEIKETGSHPAHTAAQPETRSTESTSENASAMNSQQSLEASIPPLPLTIDSDQQLSSYPHDDVDAIDDIAFDEPVFVAPTGSSATLTTPIPAKDTRNQITTERKEVSSPLLDAVMGEVENDPIALENLLADAFDQINKKIQGKDSLTPSQPGAALQQPETPSLSIEEQEKFEELVHHAIGAYLRRDFPQALRLFEECAQISPNNPQITYNIERLKKRVVKY